MSGRSRKRLCFQLHPSGSDREVVAFGRFVEALSHGQRELLIACFSEIWRASKHGPLSPLFVTAFFSTAWQRRSLESRVLPENVAKPLRLPALDGFVFRNHGMLSVSVDDDLALGAVIDGWWFDLMAAGGLLVFWTHGDRERPEGGSDPDWAELWAQFKRTYNPPEALLNACGMFAMPVPHGEYIEVWQPREADLVVSALERAAGAQHVDVEEVVDQF